MTQISIKEMIDKYAKDTQTQWLHDRSSTVGASEVGGCIRRTWYAKHMVQNAEDGIQSYGALLRGNIIERHVWLPAIQANKPEDSQLFFAGEYQKTIVDGYLSGTPDGLLIGVDWDCLSHHGIEDIGGDSYNEACIVAEGKSFDPRKNIREAVAQNVFQVHVQIGLIRFATPYKPRYALISYINASFYDDVLEFVVEFDEGVYAAAKARALKVFSSDKATDLHPEGKIAGGRECEYCPFRDQCSMDTVGTIPTREDDLNGEDAEHFMTLLKQSELAKDIRDKAVEKYGHAQQLVKDALREHGVRKVNLDGGSVYWSKVKGRSSYDTKAMENDGVDLTKYEKHGRDSDRLTIRMKG